MADETYNGWKNVETWVVSLWLNNDRKLYDRAVEIGKKNNLIDTVNKLEKMVRDGCPIVGGMYSDIITHALNQVDWLAIAKHFNED